MDVARRRATRAIASLRGTSRRVPRRPSSRRHRTRPDHGAGPLVIDLAVRTVFDQPAVRIDRVAAASARLAAGHRPSAEAVADAALRRAACERLR
jgi:hypothetical protein